MAKRRPGLKGESATRNRARKACIIIIDNSAGKTGIRLAGSRFFVEIVELTLGAICISALYNKVNILKADKTLSLIHI